MTETTAYLSPNGLNMTRGAGPASRLLVATLEGVITLGRNGPDADWNVVDRSLTNRHVGALVYEAGSGKLFAGAHADGGVWVSNDGEGRDWRRLTNGLNRPHVYSLAARRMGDQVTLLLGTAPAALYRSDDLGESWSEISSIRDVPDTDKWTFPPPPHIPHVKCILFHPHQAETIFVLVEQGALLKSTDDGRTWIELSSYSEPKELAYRDVHRLLINENDPNIFFLATGEGLYRSADAGTSWDQLTRRGDRMGYPDFLYFDPKDDNTLYMGGSHHNPRYWYETGMSESCVLRSTDHGKSWLELDHGLPKPVVGAFEAMTIHHWDGGMMMAVGSATGEVFASEDGGASWSCIAEDIAPISKDDHHLPFLSEEARREAMEHRNIN